jgi:hypothetical protein
VWVYQHSFQDKQSASTFRGLQCSEVFSFQRSSDFRGLQCSEVFRFQRSSVFRGFQLSQVFRVQRSSVFSGLHNDMTLSTIFLSNQQGQVAETSAYCSPAALTGLVGGKEVWTPARGTMPAGAGAAEGGCCCCCCCGSVAETVSRTVLYARM